MTSPVIKWKRYPIVTGQVALLQLDEHVLLMPVLVYSHRTVVEAEHRHGVALHVDELVAPRLNMHHLLAQQGGEQDFHHALVLHEVLERQVVDGVGNSRSHNDSGFFVAKVRKKCELSKNANLILLFPVDKVKKNYQITS